MNEIWSKESMQVEKVEKKEKKTQKHGKKWRKLNGIKNWKEKSTKSNLPNNQNVLWLNSSKKKTRWTYFEGNYTENRHIVI